MADLKDLYAREHSNVIRKYKYHNNSAIEDARRDFPNDNEFAKQRLIVARMLCRIRQRMLQTAFDYFVTNTGVKHDYYADMKTILTRKLRPDEFRTELEIEVIYKWVCQVKELDLTGIAKTIFLTKRKAVRYIAMQQFRLEFFGPGDSIIFQGDLPKEEDGHFTVSSWYSVLCVMRDIRNHM